MAGLVLDTTLMGANANSYCDLNFAEDYFSRHYNALKKANWNALADDDTKTQLLIQACYDLEQFRYTEDINREHSVVQGSLFWDSRQRRFTAYVTPSKAPVAYSVYQQLQFPRNRDVKPDGTIFIPERMMMAQCEQAVYLISLDESALANRIQGMNLNRIGLGGGAITLTQEYTYQGTTLAPMAYEYIKMFIYRATRMGRA